MSLPIYVELSVPEKDSAGFQLDLTPSYDEQSEARINCSGINIIVKKHHLETLAGVVIDYLPAPQDGFSIVRLHSGRA